LFADYIRESDQIGVKRRAELTSFGISLHKIVPGLRRSRVSHSGDDGTIRRVWGYLLPDLATCRAFFEQEVNQPIGWDEAEDAPPDGFRESGL
jgi:hypothetical protein